MIKNQSFTFLSRSNNKNLEKGFFLIFILFLAIFKLFFHELWKDEWQAWLVATDTDSLKDLFALLPNEGHPSLWYLLMRSVSYIFNFILPDIPDVMLLQSLHLLLAGLGFYVFFICFKINIWLKAGLALSYFLFFEYGILNRGYVLVILFAFISAVLAEKPTENYKKLAIFLFLLTQTEVYGVFMAGAFVFYILWDLLEKKKQTQVKWLPFTIISASVLVGGLLFAYILMPGSQQEQAITFHQVNETNPDKFLESLQAILVNSFWPGIVPTIHTEVSFTGVLLSMFVLAGIFITFRSQRKILFTYGFFLLLLWLFTFLIYVGYTRQWGMQLVFFISLLNLYVINSEKKRFQLPGLIFIIITVLFQLVHNGRIIIKEKNFLFSNSIEAGKFIRRKIPENLPVIGINKAYCTPVIGYSERKFYSLPEGTTFSYFKWKEKMYIPSIQDIALFRFSKSVSGVFVISYKPLSLQNYPGLQVVKFFDKPSIRQENYYLYRYP